MRFLKVLFRSVLLCLCCLSCSISFAQEDPPGGGGEPDPAVVADFQATLEMLQTTMNAINHGWPNIEEQYNNLSSWPGDWTVADTMVYNKYWEYEQAECDWWATFYEFEQYLDSFE